MNLLNNTFSCLDYNENSVHYKEIETIIDKIIDYHDYECALICKYQDPGNQNRKQLIISCKLSELVSEIEQFDIKNGFDLVRYEDYLCLMLYGQHYIYNKTKTCHMVCLAVKVMPYDNNHNFINIFPILEGSIPTVIENI